MTKARDRVRVACEAIRVKGNHCSVWKDDCAQGWGRYHRRDGPSKEVTLEGLSRTPAQNSSGRARYRALRAGCFRRPDPRLAIDLQSKLAVGAIEWLFFISDAHALLLSLSRPPYGLPFWPHEECPFWRR